MTLAFRMPFALPADNDDLTAILRQEGGISAVAAAGRAHLARAAAALDLAGLVGLAEQAGPADVPVLYQFWLAVHGQEAQACGAWFNLGVARMRLGDAAGAADAYRAALRLRPDLSEAAINLGSALEALGQPEAALAVWRMALPGRDQRRTLHNQLGRVLEEQGRLGAAAEELRASLLITPDQPDVQQHLVHMRQRMTRWPPAGLEVPGLSDALSALHCGPLAALALFDDPAQQAAVAADWISRKVAPVGARLAPATGYRHDRIRLGYLSSDFCRHAMSFLIAELLERHDRNEFEVFGYCASPEDGSDIRARVIAALDHHVPICAMSDADAAARIRADEIDILIDLNGLTKGGRISVLRWKPAPVQVTYLGYIGPVPLPELDYLLCDAVTVPPEAEALYQPRPLRIEGCYQANDSRKPDLPAVSRAGEGLPDTGFVFCCASHHYKITAEMFAAWCRIVGSVPGAVLWLVDDNPESRLALTERWQAAGLSPSQLIFALRVDPDRYRARLALADLFLDTSPYNAGTIASDALRMGLPLLTVLGQAFSARMAASLLTAVGQPNCIANDIPDYVARAVAIGRNPDRHAALKAHLAGDAWGRTLGDCAGFARRMEKALRQIRLQPEEVSGPV